MIVIPGCYPTMTHGGRQHGLISHSVTLPDTEPTSALPIVVLSSIRESSDEYQFGKCLIDSAGR